jgi:uncharacterized protein YggE
VTETGYLEVTGSGSASAPPDALIASLAAEATAPGVAEALDAADTAMVAMTAALRRHGVADTDLGTSGIQLQPDYHGSSGRPQGFRAWSGLTVTLRDLPASGDALAAAVVAGGDHSRVDSVSLAHSNPGALLAEARDAAWADAVARAEQYAGLAGRSVGAVLTVVESPGPRPPVPVARRAALSVAVEPGSQDVTASITVRFELP